MFRSGYRVEHSGHQINVRETTDGTGRRPAVRILLSIMTVVAIGVLPSVDPGVADAGDNDNSSLQQLQKQRADVRRKAASKASQVDALKASDKEVTAALAALTAEVNARRDQLEEAERQVEAARADQEAAEQAQIAKQQELDALLSEISTTAVDSFISMDSAGTIDVSAEDVNDAVNKRALVSLRATQNVSLTERFRSVQEDLEAQRVAATEAAERAKVAEAEVAARFDEVKTAYDEQQAFADQLNSRLEAALAEADALSAIDANLSKSISDKQSAIAKALAAERAAAARREAARAAQNRKAISTPSRSSGGGGGGASGGGAPVSITGSGEIVSVSGIRVHRSIAGNLANLLSAAAADGIHLSGGGFRDPAGQIAVRRNNCGSSHYAIYEMPASACRPPTARPGRSMHERGLAIDFTSGGGTLTRGSAAFAWMKANASRFGFYNLPSEPWHWSTNGN